jgi:hypothetical protein
MDTFFVRMGDVLSGVLVFIVTSLSMPTTVVAIVNIALVGVWLWIVVGIGREHRKLAGETETAPAGAAAARV